MMNKIEDFLIFFPPLHHPPQVSHNSHKFIFQKFNNIVEDEDDEDDSNDNNRECSLSRVRCYANNKDDKKGMKKCAQKNKSYDISDEKLSHFSTPP